MKLRLILAVQAVNNGNPSTIGVIRIFCVDCFRYELLNGFTDGRATNTIIRIILSFGVSIWIEICPENHKLDLLWCLIVSF